MFAKTVLFAGFLVAAAAAVAESPAGADRAAAAETPAGAERPVAARVEEVVVTAKFAGPTLTESLLAAARPTFEPPAIEIALADLEAPRLSPAPAKATPATAANE